MSSAEEIELKQVILGLEPYVLLTFFDGGEGENDLRIKVSVGGGIGSVHELRSALEMALETLPEPGNQDDE